MEEIKNYYLKSNHLFDVLTSTEKAELEQTAQLVTLSKKEALFKEGSTPKGVYIIQKGAVKVYKSTAQGKETIISVYGEGDVFGHRPLIANEPQPVSAEALCDAAVQYIPKESFLSVFMGSEKFARELLSNLTREFSVWVNKMTAFAEYSVRERIALALLILDDVYKHGNQLQSTIIISREDFAAYVGTAKESLVRHLRLLKDQGIILSERSGIRLLKPDALYKMLLAVRL